MELPRGARHPRRGVRGLAARRAHAAGDRHRRAAAAGRETARHRRCAVDGQAIPGGTGLPADRQQRAGTHLRRGSDRRAGDRARLAQRRLRGAHADRRAAGRRGLRALRHVRNGDRLRITATLVSLESEQCIWSGRFDYENEASFDAQEEIPKGDRGGADPAQRRGMGADLVRGADLDRAPGRAYQKGRALEAKSAASRIGARSCSIARRCGSTRSSPGDGLARLLHPRRAEARLVRGPQGWRWRRLPGSPPRSSGSTRQATSGGPSPPTSNASGEVRRRPAR